MENIEVINPSFVKESSTNITTPLQNELAVDAKKQVLSNLEDQIIRYSREEEEIIDEQIRLYREQKKQRELNDQSQLKNVLKKGTLNETRKSTHNEEDETKLKREKLKNADKLQKEVLRNKKIELAKRKERILENKKKVLQIVEDLIDINMDDQKFLNYCDLLCKADLDDISVERSLVSLCGYPLCSQNLDVKKLNAKQQYRIILKSHRVFDISQRKNFCTDLCFAKFKHIKEQLAEEPLWIRDDGQRKIEKKNVTLYTKLIGEKGEEIKLDVSLVHKLANELHDQGECKSDCKKCEKNYHLENAKKTNLKTKITTGNFPYIKKEDLEKLQSSMQKLHVKERTTAIEDVVIEHDSQVKFEK